jgi:hypothetical protein
MATLALNGDIFGKTFYIVLKMLSQHNQSSNVVKKFLFFINGNLVIFKRKNGYIVIELFLFFAFWPNLHQKKTLATTLMPTTI